MCVTGIILHLQQVCIGVRELYFVCEKELCNFWLRQHQTQQQQLWNIAVDPDLENISKLHISDGNWQLELIFGVYK